MSQDGVEESCEQQNVKSDATEADNLIETQGKETSDSQDSRVPVTISAEERQVLRDSMKDMFANFITDIDDHVLDVGKSQCELDSQLDKLIETLDSIKIDEKLTRDISENAKRISSLKSRLTVIHTILSDASARCSRTLTACGAALQNRSPTGATIPSSASSNQPKLNQAEPTAVVVPNETSGDN